MKKKISHIIIIIYTVVAVITTICLLAYNDYNTTEFNNNTLIIVKNDKTETYNKGDLVIVNNKSTYKEKMKVFYYVSIGKKYYIQTGTINSINKDSVVIDDTVVDKKFLIGISNNNIVIPFLGNLLSILESKWGYLVIIIFPILAAFLYEVYSILKELRW